MNSSNKRLGRGRLAALRSPRNPDAGFDPAPSDNATAPSASVGTALRAVLHRQDRPGRHIRRRRRTRTARSAVPTLASRSLIDTPHPARYRKDHAKEDFASRIFNMSRASVNEDFPATSIRERDACIRRTCRRRRRRASSPRLHAHGQLHSPSSSHRLFCGQLIRAATTSFRQHRSATVSRAQRDSDIQSAHTGRSVVTTCCWRSSLTRTRDSLISCGAAHTFFGERPASLRQLALSATVALLFTACPHTRSRVRLRSTETYGRASLPLQGSAYLL
jgi:hypothetical protein